MAHKIDAYIVDRRQSLDADNMFRSYQRNSMPKLPESKEWALTTKTAEEVEAERLTF